MGWLIFRLLTNVLSTCLIRKNSFCSSISCWLEGEKRKSITLTTHKNFLKEAETLKHILLLCHSYPKTNHLDTSGRTALTAFIREVPESHAHRIVWKKSKARAKISLYPPSSLEPLNSSYQTDLLTSYRPNSFFTWTDSSLKSST